MNLCQFWTRLWVAESLVERHYSATFAALDVGRYALRAAA